MRLQRTVALLLTTASFAAFGVELDPAGIKAKVDDARKARDASMRAFAQDKADEGKKLAESSTAAFNEAKEEYDSIHAAESSDPAVLIDYSDLLNETGDVDLAEKALLRAISIDSENASAWLKLGQTEAKLGPRAESHAILALRRAAGFEPKSDVTVQANAGLGVMYQQAGLYDLSREAFTKALAQDPNHAISKIAIASLDAREGKMAKAKAAYDSLGDDTMQQYGPFVEQNLRLALNDFERLRRSLDDTAEAHLAYAELLVRAGRFQDCYGPLARALKLDDKNYISWNLMGSVLRAQDKNAEALDAFRKSLALNADQPRTRDAIAELEKVVTTPAATPPAATANEPAAAPPVTAAPPPPASP